MNFIRPNHHILYCFVNYFLSRVIQNFYCKNSVLLKSQIRTKFFMFLYRSFATIFESIYLISWFFEYWRECFNDSVLVCLQQLMQTLEQRKYEAIQFTYKQVSKYFGEVFKQLVPAGSAQLVMRTASKKGNDDEDEVNICLKKCSIFSS